MSAELVRDMINYEKLIGESSSQTMVDGDIILGERNPEIHKVIRIDGKTIVTSSEVIEDKLLVEGKVFFDVLYTSDEDNRSVYKVSAASNYNHTLQIPGALTSMLNNVNVFVEHIEYELLNERRLKVNAVVDISGGIYNRETVDCITDIKGHEIQILKNNVELNEYIGNGAAEVVVGAKLEMEEDKGEIKNLLSCKSFIRRKEIAVLEGRVNVTGSVVVKAMYTLVGDERLYNGEIEVPFTQEVLIAELKANMVVDLRLVLGDLYEEIKENENGERKIIEVEALIKIAAKAFSKRELQSIVDAYSSEERYELEKESISTLAFLGENDDSQTIKDRINIGNGKKPIAQILNVIAEPVVTDIKLLEDKILFEGVIAVSTIYAEASEEGGIESHIEELPMKAILDIPAARIDMLPEVTVNIVNIVADRASDRDIDVKVLIEYTGKVYYKTNMELIKSITETTMPDISDMPSLMIYVVQASDTLWNIAKRYYSTVESIVALNDLVEPDNLKVGMKLIIPKKTFMK